jgi:sugar O-acyltransferase (sialic acid O-acetyltransferase NeuD family)
MTILAIIGAGQLGIQAAHYAITDNHYEKVVFFDDFNTNSEINGYEILGNIEQVLTQYNLGKFDELLIGIGYNNLEKRKELFNQFVNIVPFGKIIHSSSRVDIKATIHEGCIIYPGCEIDYNSKIEVNTVVANNCTIAHDAEVGKHSFLSARIALAGFAKTGDLCFIGINTTIIDNVFIADNTRIGAGTVVIKSIEKAGLYVGNPAKFVR